MSPKHTTGGNVVVAIATFVVGLIVGAALYGGLEGLEDWQTLVAASIALLAAFIAWRNAMTIIASTRSLEEEKRRKEAGDVAQVIFIELAHMASRCCFDSESPWAEYWKAGASAKSRKKFDVQKFAPAVPIMYPATAPKLAVLGEGPSRAVIEFYYRLSALRRDIEEVVRREPNEPIPPHALEIVAFRFALTLKPALEAIRALKPLVQNADDTVTRVLATFDETRRQKEPGTLEDRITRLLEDVPSDWVRIDRR